MFCAERFEATLPPDDTSLVYPQLEEWRPSGNNCRTPSTSKTSAAIRFASCYSDGALHTQPPIQLTKAGRRHRAEAGESAHRDAIHVKLTAAAAADCAAWGGGAPARECSSTQTNVTPRKLEPHPCRAVRWYANVRLRLRVIHHQHRIRRLRAQTALNTFLPFFCLKFYKCPQVGAHFLAGSVFGWNASERPLTEETLYLRAESSVLDFVCVRPSFPAANLAGVPVYPRCVWTETLCRFAKLILFHVNGAVCLTGLPVTEGCLSPPAALPR